MHVFLTQRAVVILWVWSPPGHVVTNGSEVGRWSESIIAPVVHTGSFPGVSRGINTSIDGAHRDTTIDYRAKVRIKYLIMQNVALTVINGGRGTLSYTVFSYNGY